MEIGCETDPPIIFLKNPATDETTLIWIWGATADLVVKELPLFSLTVLPENDARKDVGNFENIVQLLWFEKTIIPAPEVPGQTVLDLF